MVSCRGTVSSYNKGCRCDDCHAAKMAYDKAWKAARKAANFVGATHGTLATYRLGCRCELCAARNRRYQRAREAEAQANGFIGYEHGTATCYRVGCRCAACRLGQSITRQLKQQSNDALCVQSSQLKASRPAMPISSPDNTNSTPWAYWKVASAVSPARTANRDETMMRNCMSNP